MGNSLKNNFDKVNLSTFPSQNFWLLCGVYCSSWLFWMVEMYGITISSRIVASEPTTLEPGAILGTTTTLFDTEKVLFIWKL